MHQSSVFSSKDVNSASFIEVLESEWPIVLNWSYEMTEKAISVRHLDDNTSLGISIESSKKMSLECLDYDDSCEPEPEDHTLMCDSEVAMPCVIQCICKSKIFTNMKAIFRTKLEHT